MSTEANNTMQGKEIELPSGRKALVQKYKGKHVREATRLIDGESDKMMFALISLTTTIDGQPVLMEDLDEMDGKDVMALIAEFGANF